MVQEVTKTSWVTRIKNALIGIFFGIALIIGSFYLIFWNEGNSLHTAQSLEQAHNILITVPIAPIDPKNDLQVVYLNGLASTTDILQDKTLGLSENAIQLNRTVEMYQWQENVTTKTEKNVGGSEQETKNYSYKQVWSSSVIDSSQFKEQVGHLNPANMLIESKIQYAKNVNVGDFQLPHGLITQMSGDTPVDLADINLASLKEMLHKNIQPLSENLYVGENPTTPKIGDLKISLTKITPQTVSIIAQQIGTTLQAYMAPAGKSVLLLAMGTQSPDQMINDALSANKLLMWLLRLASLIMMIIGIALILQPLVIIADIVPFIGSIIGFGTGLIAFVVGLCLWTIGIAIAWFTVRPLWAIGLIVIVVVICYGVVMRKKQKMTASSK